jgi:hypothetical protein
MAMARLVASISRLMRNRFQGLNTRESVDARDLICLAWQSSKTSNSVSHRISVRSTLELPTDEIYQGEKSPCSGLPEALRVS